MARKMAAGLVATRVPFCSTTTSTSSAAVAGRTAGLVER